MPAQTAARLSSFRAQPLGGAAGRCAMPTEPQEGLRFGEKACLRRSPVQRRGTQVPSPLILGTAWACLLPAIADFPLALLSLEPHVPL